MKKSQIQIMNTESQIQIMNTELFLRKLKLI